jgi:hypothetical protein
METGLRLENARLAKELEDAQLDLDDARRSRRDLQQQLNLAQQRVGQFSVDCDSMRVRAGFQSGACVLMCAESQSLHYGFDRWRWYDREYLPPGFEYHLTCPVQ